ncbi:MAG TPA: hypothetical protein VD770_04255 [Coxiellaceae bacterium]|nr:hypothetical protein [Coxiellaceae bacterium]
MAEQGNRPLSTFAKLALSDWKALAKLIAYYSTPIHKEPVEDENLKPLVLTDAQLQEALQGPFSSFLKQKMREYASIGKVKAKNIITQQEFFKRDNPPDTTPDENGLTAEIASHVSIPTLNSLLDQMHQLTHEHNQQWIEANTYWKNGLAQYFEQSSMNLSEIEKQDFMTDVSATELLNQFSELKIEAPKTKQGCTTFGAYLKLKSALAVYSSLSRRLQSHTENDVNQFLKPLLNYFSDVEKYEQQMLSNQRTQALQVLQPIAYAMPPE